MKWRTRHRVKRRVAKLVALFLLRLPPLERLFAYLCAKPLLRRWFKLGGIAFGCLQVLSQPEIRIANLAGYRMYVNISEPLGITACFYREKGTVWLAKELIGVGDTCVDAGAHMGHYALHMASLVTSKGRVIAFEPQPQYFTMIGDSIRLNNFDDFVSVDSRALWNRSGESLKFYLSQNPHNSGHSSLVNHGVHLSENHTIQVRTIRLSDYLERAGTKECKLLKVDVERAELQVLQGASEFLRDGRVDFIILEMFANGDAHGFLQELGYCCFLIDGAIRTLVSMSKVERGFFGDYLFVSPHSLQHFKENYAAVIR